MSWTPNRIRLTDPNGRYDELVSAATLYPGMLLKKQAAGTLIAHNVIGGKKPWLVAIEDVKRAANITQPLTSGDAVPFVRPAPNDVVLLLLKSGQNVTAQTPLMSAGDGTVMAAAGPLLHQIVAPSSTITNVTAETTFSNGTYTIPANSLSVGDVIHIRLKAYAIAQNSTNTHRIKSYIGSTNIGDNGAVSMAAADVAIQDIYLTIRTIGASGTLIGTAFISSSASGTFTDLAFTLASTAVDTTATQAITVKSTASAMSAGNQIRLDEYTVEIIRNDGTTIVALADEAIDNSAGAGSSPMSEHNTSASAFIRALFV